MTIGSRYFLYIYFSLALSESSEHKIEFKMRDFTLNSRILHSEFLPSLDSIKNENTDPPFLQKNYVPSLDRRWCMNEVDLSSWFSRFSPWIEIILFELYTFVTFAMKVFFSTGSEKARIFALTHTCTDEIEWSSCVAQDEAWGYP